MKNYTDIETGLIEAIEGLKSGFFSLLNNAGRAVALITASVTALAMFTDIGFVGIGTAGFLSSLLLLLTSAYIIYFSLEDSGERLGEKSTEYCESITRYKAVLEKISGEDVDALRKFCEVYAKREFEYRRRTLMLSLGISDKDIEDFHGGKRGRSLRRAVKKVERLHAAKLTPKMLLSCGTRQSGEELRNPDGRKLLGLMLKLIPTTLCMTVTVTVMLTGKESMSAADAINALLKLSSLAIVGFRGYSAGYTYSKRDASSWISTKAGILESFVKERGVI